MCPAPSSPDVTASDTAPLDETEINRLIAAARSESYRPSDAARRAPVDSFRPKSLLELARLRREAEKASLPPDPGEGGATPGPAPAVMPLGEGVPLDADDADGGVWDATVAPQSAPAEAVSGPDDPSPGAWANTPLEIDPVPLPGDAPTAGLPKPAQPADGPKPMDAEALERIRAEAYAAGRADAEAEARAGVAAATEVLEAAAQALMQPAADATASLRAEITEAVLTLASERAGLEIDAMPDAFVERIEALADRIHSRAIQPVLRLHPDDLVAIEPFVAASDSLSAMRIVAAPELSRGDVDLTVEGLRLSDRILGQPAPRKARRSAPTPKSGI